MHDQPSPSGIIERLEAAEQLKLAGAYEQALIILEALLVEDPENVSALEEVADNELSLEHHSRAEAAAEQAIALDAESYTGHYILGFLRSQEEEWGKALVHMQKANKLKPNNAEILRCLGWALFNGGQRAQGIVTLERSLNLDDESPLALCDLGVAYLQTRNTVKAKALFLRTLELDPENVRAKECVQAVDRMEQMLIEKKSCKTHA
jgi:tetratricopeptide (TPR) repeat protein